LIDKIKKLSEKLDELIKEEERILPRVTIENSIFIPILLKNEKIDKISPPGLVESEEKFVKELKKYLKKILKF